MLDGRSILVQQDIYAEHRRYAAAYRQMRRVAGASLAASALAWLGSRLHAWGANRRRRPIEEAPAPCCAGVSAS